ncbi:helix-turn-helix domain-containing protein [Microbacterium esteraromaticum]|uniref:helix-turn-helix domain-containing protein n=1 Tax=Microbacterium esteraromaticum TaxID=57043 RepID=UPI001CD3DC4E|nr:helix-turn-helix domain-containing protein [Microbacterium esteraromaticum]MCA1307979.1 helix-turn-helix domain-containing protein [Microbacterium esteraromaticum]
MARSELVSKEPRSQVQFAFAQDARHSIAARRSLRASADAAVYLGVGYSTLREWRSEGRGSKYAKIGGSVLYRPADLDAFVASKLVA